MSITNLQHSRLSTHLHFRFSHSKRTPQPTFMDAFTPINYIPSEAEKTTEGTGEGPESVYCTIA